ncbi:transposase [Stenotrophomonas sp.]|uniref:REP-associated tyrosine transposase n=1 Tax=Stenotrophomonas sp. TaxID=69392 RepID=UPI002FC9AFE2
MASPRLQRGRYSHPGFCYALTTTTHARRRWFEDAPNAELVIDTLRHLDRSGHSGTLAWVVMPDHVHWLMQLRQGTLADCMAVFKSRSARLLNARLGRQGKLWQHGYFDHAVRTDASLRKHALYLLANPIRAGLATALGEYPYAWSRWPVDG